MAAAIPFLAAAGGGLVLNQLNENQADKQRKDIINQMSESQRLRTARQAAETLNESRKYAAPQRQVALKEADVNAGNELQRALQVSDATTYPSDARGGKVSPDYTGLSAKNEAQATLTGQQRKNILAAVRSPWDLRNTEAERRASVSEDVANQGNSAELAMNAGRQDLASVRANPWVQLLSQGLTTFGAVGTAGALSNAERAKTIQAMLAANSGMRYGAPAYGGPGQAVNFS